MWSKPGPKEKMNDSLTNDLNVTFNKFIYLSVPVTGSTDLYSNTPLIDHLVMREFVSGPPNYRFIYERVRD